MDILSFELGKKLGGDSPGPGPGPGPSGKDVLVSGLRFSNIEPITDVLTGGEKYEPQS